MASSDTRKYSVQVYEFLDDHPKYKRGQLYDHFKHINKKTVSSNFDRWHARRKTAQTTKRPPIISPNSEDNEDKKEGAGKQRNTPTNLTKIDDSVVETYLCSLIDFDDPKENIARLIVSWIDRKGRIKVEKPQEDKSEKVLDKEFERIMDAAKNYTRDIEQSSIS